MNHGPRNAVLVIALFAFLSGGLFFTLPGTALAEDRAQIDELFDQAQDLWKRGKTEECAAVLKKLLAADPSQATAYDLLRKAEHQMFLDLLKAGGDSELAARRLLDLAHPGEMDRIKDDAATRDLAEKAVHGEDHGVRMKAIRQLIANHGEYGVPALVPYLGSNDTDERVYAITALVELGADAVLPLIEALQSENWLVQQNAAIVLERVADIRALGGLVALAAHSENASVKEVAAKGVATLAAKAGDLPGAVGELTPANAYMALATMYFTKDPMVLKNYLGAYSIWSMDAGKLVSREVPKFLYHLELAEECVYDALDEEPANMDLRVRLAFVHYAQLGVMRAIGKDALSDDHVKALAEGYAKVRAITAAQGCDASLGALGLGLKHNLPEASVTALGVLPDIWDDRNLEAGNEIVAALASEDKIVRFAAAVAILKIAPTNEFGGWEQVVPIAAQAADTGSARIILHIEPNADVRAASGKAISDGKMFPIGEASGARGFRRALEVGIFDVIVIRWKLTDMLTTALVNQLRKDFRTQATPILITGTEEELAEAKEALGTKVQGYFAPELAAGDVADAAAGSMNDDQERALMISKAACDALGLIDTTNTLFTNFGEAEQALIGVVQSDKPDDIRLAALATLGSMGSANAADALVATFAGTANATSVRVAAAATLGQIFKGQAAPAAVFDALLAGFGDEAAAVREACGVALGGLELTGEQRTQVVKEWRVK
ncbi:MAG: HEAT repeat domain-containing protein [Planctomycetota bacterium]